MATAAVAIAAALGVVQFYRPPVHPLITPAYAQEPVRRPLPFASPAADAFGLSGDVKLRFALPRATVTYPLVVRGDPTTLGYQWVRAADSVAQGRPLPLASADLIAPAQPGFYLLTLVRGSEHRIVDGLTVAVLVPFSQKLGATLDGYRIGSYLADRIRGHDHPDGFVKVAPADLELPVSRHFRLADFVVHAGQGEFPRYAALNPRLLDKLELVLDELGSGTARRVEMDVHVNSGFRAPAYNGTVRRAARDSRHQYGDAADLRIDADGDGRFTQRDVRLVIVAVEAVEREYPELAGGLGVYTSANYRAPYVHIDTRGTSTRWEG